MGVIVAVTILLVGNRKMRHGGRNSSGDVEMEFQTRSELNGLRQFDSLTEAFAYAAKNPDLWKISFTLPTDEYLRLVKRHGYWLLEDIHGNSETNQIKFV
jgi:hypothetical protein